MQFDIGKARFYAILDTGYVAEDRICEVYRALLRGGADLVQLRAKDAGTARRQALVDALLPDYAASGVPLVVNDDLAVTAAYPGLNLGLHLGQDDTPPEQARERLGAGHIIGLSTHSPEQARQAIRLARARVIDYFAVGPVFATPTKPDYPAVGLALAREVEAMNPPVPWFCIGGITRTTLPQVTAAGIHRVVAVSDVLNDPDPAAAVAAFQSALGR